jgi:hypothetical protein
METISNKLNLLKQQINNHRKVIESRNAMIANLKAQKEVLVQQRERLVKGYVNSSGEKQEAT